MKNNIDIEYKEFEPWRSMNFICKHVGCSRDTLLSWIRDKGLPGVQIGRTWRFKLSEVDAWLKLYKEESTMKPRFAINQTMM